MVWCMFTIYNCFFCHFSINARNVPHIFCFPRSAQDNCLDRWPLTSFGTVWALFYYVCVSKDSANWTSLCESCLHATDEEKARVLSFVRDSILACIVTSRDFNFFIVNKQLVWKRITFCFFFKFLVNVTNQLSISEQKKWIVFNCLFSIQQQNSIGSTFHIVGCKLIFKCLEGGFWNCISLMLLTFNHL